MRSLAVTCLMALSLILVWGAAPAWSEPVDYSLYAELLRDHVRDGAVDYAGLKREEAKLDRFLAGLASVEVDSLGREEALAFWINAYNAWTLKLILKHYPGIESIREIGGIFSGPWDQEIVRAGGRTLTLDQVEHEIIRPRFQDPRIHFAVNCASRSCPPLIAEPYRGATIEAQLERVTTEFINDPKSTYLKGDTLHVTKIMDWYDEDFAQGPAAFVRRYARGGLATALAKAGDIQIRYLDYDWSLNGR